jgi:hypothetical protein
MQDMTTKAWQRSGSSIIWSVELLGPLILAGEAMPLRTVLGWMTHGFTDEPPGGRTAILVGGLQTVLESFPAEQSDAAFAWLRHNIKPLVRATQVQWDRVALIFAMHGPDKAFTYNEADELVYFRGSRERAKQVKLTLGIWNGAATGLGTFRLPVPETKETGGYHVNRVS